MEGETKLIFAQIAEKLMPTSQKIHEEISSFVQTEYQSLAQLNRNNDTTLMIFKKKLQEYDQYLSDIKAKKQKDTSFMERGQHFLTAKSKEIKVKIQSLQTINTGIKESITNLKPQALAKLPVQKEAALKQMFQAVYTILYGNQNKFQWKQFQEKALLTEHGGDFIFRLLNVDYKSINTTQNDDLLKVKNDPKLDDLVVNASYGPDLLSLAQWIDYVCFGKQFSDEKKKLDHEYEKIRLQIEHRSDGSLQMSEQFWTSSLNQLDNAQNNLMSYQSDIQTLLSRMATIRSDIRDSQEKIAQKVNQINQM